MREPGSGTRMITLGLFEKHGLTPKIRMELSTNEAIREAILAGLGVSVLSRFSLGLEPEQKLLTCLDVEEFPLERYWHFVYPVGKQLCVAARAFMDFARSRQRDSCLGARGKPNNNKRDSTWTDCNTASLQALDSSFAVRNI